MNGAKEGKCSKALPKKNGEETCRKNKECKSGICEDNKGGLTNGVCVNTPDPETMKKFARSSEIVQKSEGSLRRRSSTATYLTHRAKADARCGGCLAQKAVVDTAKAICGDNCKLLVQLKKILKLLVTDPRKVTTFCGATSAGGAGADLPPFFEVKLMGIILGHKADVMCRLDTGDFEKSAKQMARCVWPAVQASLKALTAMGNDTCTMVFMNSTMAANKTVAVKAEPPLQKAETPKGFPASSDPAAALSKSTIKHHKNVFVNAFTSGHQHGEKFCKSAKSQLRAETLLQIEESDKTTAARLTDTQKHKIFDKIERREAEIVQLASQVQQHNDAGAHKIEPVLGTQEKRDVEAVSAGLKPLERILFELEGPSVMDLKHLVSPQGPQGTREEDQTTLDNAQAYPVIGESLAHTDALAEDSRDAVLAKLLAVHEDVKINATNVTKAKAKAEKKVYKLGFTEGFKCATDKCQPHSGAASNN